MNKGEVIKLFQTEHIDTIFEHGVVLKDGIPLPLEIELSLVDACTRHCTSCPRNNDTIAPHTSLRMTDFLYKKIAQELKTLGFNGLVMLSGYGECLLHEDIVSVVRTFNFTKVDITTNGDRLTRELIQKIKDAGIYKIMVSVYEKEKMPYFQEMSKGFEDIVILRNRYEHFDRLFNNRAGTLYEEGISGVCYYPFYIMMIGSNGDVFPCCQEWQRRLKMGNLYQKNLWDIWTSEDFFRVRNELKRGKRTFFPCRICNVEGTMRGGNNFDLYPQ